MISHVNWLNGTHKSISVLSQCKENEILFMNSVFEGRPANRISFL